MKVHLFLIVTLLFFLSIEWLAEAAVLPRAEEGRTTLRVGSFNIQVFGKSKMKKKTVAQEIKKIVERYDVLLVQEVRDSSGKAIKKLLKMLELPFDYCISKRTGRTSSKEQYAFFYRTDKVKVLGTYQYDDPNDDFEREPFAAKLAPLGEGHDAITLIALHSKPDDATAEIGHLPDVIAKAQDKLGNDSEPVVLGDLNADCGYSNHRKRVKAHDFLTLNTNYDWLIKDGTDTTTGNTHCAYDRIIIRNSLKKNLVEYSTQVFDYKKWLHLDQKETLRVSDHFPVEAKFTL